MSRLKKEQNFRKEQMRILDTLPRKIRDYVNYGPRTPIAPFQIEQLIAAHGVDGALAEMKRMDK